MPALETGEIMNRPPLVLLHGALGAREQFEPLTDLLQGRFEVHAIDFEGHGASPLKDRPCRMEHFAENVLAYLDDRSLAAAAIFGHSMGGHVGMHLARYAPRRVTGVFTLGTKFVWTPELAEREVGMMMPEKILQKVPHFAERLRRRHSAAGWIALLEKMREMQLYMGRHDSLPDAEIRSIRHKVRIGVGDRDQMVPIEEAVKIYRLLPEGQLQVFPDTPHPLEKVSPRYLSEAIGDFFL
jgi:pimeloyl-ACP methyl ester carboxylesterase